MKRGAFPTFAVFAAWLLAMLLCIAQIARTHFIADLSAFMPSMPTERQQLLVDQLRDGIVARLIMVGIEGGDAPERARLSRELAQALRADPAFLSVQNGEAATQDRDQAYFFDHRYLLSPAVRAERFTAEGLHQAIADAIANLSGDAGLALKHLFLQDPTGETLALLEQFAGDSQPASQEGAWASRDGQRAILLLQTRAAGSDTDAQAQAIATIRQAFQGLKAQAGTRLVMSGTGVFSVSSRATIEHEVSRLATASIVLVVTLLVLVYRSLGLLLLGLLPVLTGALVGIAAVSLGFGHVHGLTLGFGTTLIGEAVDYSIYLFIQRAGGSDPSGFWRTIRLGVLTSVTGFAAMLLSGFPGLSQLGLYSISGLLAAALVTRYLLPQLMTNNLRLRELPRTADLLKHVFERATQWRTLVPLLLLLAGAVLAWQHERIWNRQLSALSPVSRAEQELDASLRSDLGAPDMRYIASFSAPNVESALQGAERAGAVLRQQVDAGVLGGFNSPALVWPSQATQAARRAALPDASEARARLAQAVKGLPVKAERLDGFLDALQQSRRAPLLNRSDLKGTSAAMLVDSLLVQREHDVLVLMPLKAGGQGKNPDLIDVDRLSAALQPTGLARITVIDLLEEATNIFDRYLHEALLMSGLGSLAIVVLLLLALRSPRRTLAVALPLACAVLCVTAGLLLSGHTLTILHLVGLLLVVAVGSNYALFFDAGLQHRSEAEQRQTRLSLVVANLATVGSFGLLGLSKVPVLSAIGMTVGPGALLALVFSAMLARKPTHAHV